MINGKKVIGIFGGSGSGKTTTSKLLNKKINNAIMLVLDPFMHKHWEEHKKEILSSINMKEDNTIWRRTCITKTPESMKTAISFINTEIEEDVKKSIIENNKSDYIIIDWAFIPYTSIYNECDITICLDTDFNIKLNRLSSKLEKNNCLEKWPKEALFGRITNTALNEFGYSAKYTINNNGTMADLENEINKILETEKINYKK